MTTSYGNGARLHGVELVNQKRSRVYVHINRGEQLNQSNFYYYRRNLPHFITSGGIYFVTFRLAGTIPDSVLEQFKRETAAVVSVREQSPQTVSVQSTEKQKERLFWFVEDYLDDCMHGEKLFAQNDIAEIVMDGIKKRDGTMYRLLACTVMPNHVHMILRLPEREPHLPGRNEDWHCRLATVIGSLKKRTASTINIRLGRNGHLWQYETYDHLVRNAEELKRIVRYVLYNPVKAGLVKDPEAWKWNFCAEDIYTMTP
jgi:putative transposase